MIINTTDYGNNTLGKQGTKDHGFFSGSNNTATITDSRNKTRVKNYNE